MNSNLARLLRSILAVVLAASFLLAVAPTVFADTTLSSVQNASLSPLQSLSTFARSVSNGRPRQLVGVYAPNVMSFPVVQQPGGNSAYVSTQANTLTQFAAASNYGSTGLLAHNTLAGAYFYKLKTGDTLSMVYGDGSVVLFRVRQIQMYQALEPFSPYSDFVDLPNPGVSLTSTDLFNRTYGQAGVLVLQTCLSRDGNDSWGRIFIIATAIQGNAADIYKTYGYGKVSGMINTASLSLSYAQ